MPNPAGTVAFPAPSASELADLGPLRFAENLGISNPYRPSPGSLPDPLEVPSIQTGDLQPTIGRQAVIANPAAAAPRTGPSPALSFLSNPRNLEVASLTNEGVTAAAVRSV